jgi:hypothetical protein
MQANRYFSWSSQGFEYPLSTALSTAADFDPLGRWLVIISHQWPVSVCGHRLGAGWSEEDDVVAGGDEVQGAQVGDGVAVESRFVK